MWSLGVIAYIVLTTQPPFDEDTTISLSDQVNRLFVEDHWKEKSMYCKDFIAGLLTVDERTRLTAQQAIRHPWFTGLGASKAASIALEEKKFKEVSSFEALPAPPVPLSMGLTATAKRKHASDASVCELRTITNINGRLREDKKVKRKQDKDVPMMRQASE